MKTNYFMLMEGEPGALVGGGTPPESTPEPTPEPTPGGTPPEESIYGDLDVKFPEGLDEDLKQSTFLKPFVSKDSGEFNYSNLMKSYVHAQKNMNSAKVTLPTESSTDQELNEFWSKLGYKVDESEYVLNRAEEAKLTEDQVADIKKFARENRMPLPQAQKLVDYMESQATEGAKTSTEAVAAQIEEGLNGLKTEWGQAYDQKLVVAQRVLGEVADDAMIEVFTDPRIGSNPQVIKLLAKLGEGLYKEDSMKGDSNPTGMLSPEEASIKINEIMGDKEGPYWNKSHASHQDVVNQVQKLFKMKEGR